MGNPQMIGPPMNRTNLPGSVNGTPEFAYGVTDWWELGLYFPFAIQDQQFLSDSFKVRTLFVAPQAERRDFFHGVNFELSNSTPKFARTRFGLEIRPIIGIRNPDWEFIVNPIVDIGLGRNGEADFAPAARLARKLGPNLSAGLEYYSDFGEIGHFGKLADQQHTLFAVTDFKLGVFDVDFGLGYGLTPASDRFVVKTSWAMHSPFRGETRQRGDARIRTGESDGAVVSANGAALSAAKKPQLRFAFPP
jgi:hypothetical protein